jgi:hypothetical protein
VNTNAVGDTQVHAARKVDARLLALNQTEAARKLKALGANESFMQ